MRRVLRHFFTACSALSLLLCVAVCVLWVRSYGYSDDVALLRVGRPDRAVAYWARSSVGAVGFRMDETVYPPGTMSNWAHACERQGVAPRPGLTAVGFGTTRKSRKIQDRER